MKVLFSFSFGARTLVTAFFLFLLIPSLVSAYDCQGNSDCLSLQQEDPNLVASWLYVNSTYPDHDFIKDFNEQVRPIPQTFHAKGVIQHAWFYIATIQPSILYDAELFVTDQITTKGVYDYKVQLPSDKYYSRKRDGRVCRLRYSLNSKQAQTYWFLDGKQVGTNPEQLITVKNDALLTGRLIISASVREREYRWDRDCVRRSGGRCRKYEWNCEYERYRNQNHQLIIDDTQEVNYYQTSTPSSFTITDEYSDTEQGTIYLNPRTNTQLIHDNGYLINNNIAYSATFRNKEYLQLTAYNISESTRHNTYSTNNYTYFKESNLCEIKTTDFFSSSTTQCEVAQETHEDESFQKARFGQSWNLLFMISTFVFIMYLFYKLLKNYWGKVAGTILALMFVIPNVEAASDTSCSITNLGSCLPQKFYDFFLDLINAPLDPLLNWIKNLLANAPNIEIFYGIWAIIVYAISLFYGILLLYAGFQFMFSGHDVIRREMAKQWLKNTIIMIVLIQGSFYIYGLINELGSVMTSSILSLIDTNFFRLTADNLINVGLEMLLVTIYVLTLLITLMLLVMRYLTIALGVVLFPIGIFCYFVPPLRSYGKLIINLLLGNIFITFIAGIVILVSAQLLTIPFFTNIKILVMINCFCIVNLLFIILAKHIITKSGMSDGAEKVAEAAKYVAMLA